MLADFLVMCAEFLVLAFTLAVLLWVPAWGLNYVEKLLGRLLARRAAAGRLKYATVGYWLRVGGRSLAAGLQHLYYLLLWLIWVPLLLTTYLSPERCDLVLQYLLIRPLE